MPITLQLVSNPFCQIAAMATGPVLNADGVSILTLTSITVTLPTGALAAFVLPPTCTMPAAVLGAFFGVPNAGVYNLKSAAQIGSDAQDLTDDIANVASEALKQAARNQMKAWEDAKTALTAALASNNLLISAAGGANSFLGAQTLAGAAISATLSIAMEQLLDGSSPAGGYLLRAEASASVNATLFGAGAAAAGACTASIAFLLRRGGLNGAPFESFLLPRLRPAAGAASAFDPGWSDPILFAGPHLNIALPDPTRLLDFGVPALLGGGTMPITINWTVPVPSLGLALALNNGDLTIPLPPAAGAAGDILFTPAGAAASTIIGQIQGFRFGLAGGSVTLTGQLVLGAAQPLVPPTPLAARSFVSRSLPILIDIPAPTLSITASGGPGNQLTVNLANPLAGTGQLVTLLQFRNLKLSAASDPTLFLAFDADVTFRCDISTGALSAGLTALKITAPNKLELITALGQTALPGALRLLSLISPNDPVSADPNELAAVINILGRFAAIIAASLADAAAILGSALLDASAFLLNAAETMVQALRNAMTAIDSYLLIELRLDARSWALQQIGVTRAGTAPTQPTQFSTAALTLNLPADWQPGLLLDFTGPRPFLGLMAFQRAGVPSTSPLTLSTDLWLGHANAPSEPVRAIDSTSGGGTDTGSAPLLQVTASFQPNIQAVALLSFCGGAAKFFQAVVADQSLSEVVALAIASAAGPRPIPGQVALLGASSGLVIKPFGPGDLTFGGQLAKNVQSRLLPFLLGPASNPTGPGVTSVWGQSIAIGSGLGTATFDSARFTLSFPIPIILTLDTLQASGKITFVLDLVTLKASLSANAPIEICGPATATTQQLLGLTAAISAQPAGGSVPAPDAQFKQFTLDFSDGDIRLAFANDTAVLKLSYPRIASSGPGLVFIVDDFAIAKSGIDLTAHADDTAAVPLAGIEVPFRFTDGGVQIKSSKLQSFHITGKGQLPPTLIGEANLTAALDFGLNEQQALTFKSASVTLDKGSSPIRSDSTCISLSLQKVELTAKDFGDDGIHFWFMLSGSGRFAPSNGQFADGLLKNLADLEIEFDNAPLTTNITVLKRYLGDFQIAVRTKNKINFFDLFSFELRSFGLHPQSPRFNNDPAIAISGQMNFAETGDTVNPSIDFHQLWIAPPAKGQSLPRIAFDGLGVAMTIGGAQITATALTVDGSMPTLDNAAAPNPHFVAHGFLADGSLIIEGWAPMAAALGFLQISPSGGGDQRLSFFVYGEARQLSIMIPTPVSTLYLREVGFGLGYRYTFAGLAAADQVKSPNELVTILDEVSKRQGQLSSFAAWAPEPEGNNLTLAMRALFTVASASAEGSTAVTEAERVLANPFLFDVAAALRSDLTFLLTARVWLNTNYYTWVYGELDDDTPGAPPKVRAADIQTSPALRGYLYLSAPRKTFLGRVLSDGTGYLGNTPPLNPDIEKAMRNVAWSATMLIQPGLFHFELGWPYELTIHFVDNSDFSQMKVDLFGGLIFRIEDGAMLYGIAFRGSGFAQLGGTVGSDSFGASAKAQTDFQIDGKFIAYIAVADPSRTLFYGAFSFSCTTSLSINVWLRIHTFLGHIKLSLGLSLSRTITLALEVAATPDTLGGRGSASVAFSAFGRTVQIGASLAFNADKVEQARQRVQRFMALGIAAAIPDPAQGLQPPPTAVPPSTAAVQTDRTAQDRQALTNAVAPANPPPAQAAGTQAATAPGLSAADVNTPSFWAVLFAVPADPGKLLILLVPRDHTELPGVPGANAPPPPDPQNLPSTFPPSTFYVVPSNSFITSPDPSALTDFEITADAALLPLLIPADYDYASFPGGAAPSDATHLRRRVYRSKTLSNGQAPDGSTINFQLNDLLYHCYLLLDQNGARLDDGHYLSLLSGKLPAFNLREPPYIPIDPSPQRLPADQAAATESLRAAGEKQLPIAPATAICGMTELVDYAREVEERRSSILTAITESAADLASAANMQGGTLAFPGSTTGMIDARDFGLLFLVDRDRLEPGDAATQLFATPAASDVPAISRFTIIARTDPHTSTPINTQTPQPVWLLNPPSRFFELQNPMLDGAQARLTRNGIELDWDLTPLWGAAVGPYNDPEFQVRHYLIRRDLLTGDGIPDPRFPSLEINVKAGAPHQRTIDANGALRLARLRHSAHFVDRLDDVAAIQPELAGALLQNGEDPWAAWNQAQMDHLGYSLLYTVVPVDLAGTRGAPAVIAFAPQKPQENPCPLRKVELTFQYRLNGLDDALPEQGDAATLRAPLLFLRIDDPTLPAGATPPQPYQPVLPPDGTQYRLRFRREIAQPGGIFGIDSLNQAAARPTPAQFGAELRGQDFEIIVEMTNSEQVLADDPDGISRPFTNADRFQPLPIYATIPPPKNPSQKNPIRGDACFLAKRIISFPGDGGDPVIAALSQSDLDELLRQLVQSWPAGKPPQQAELVAYRAGAARLSGRPLTTGFAPDLTNFAWCPADLCLLVSPVTGSGTAAAGGPGPLIETMVELFEHPRQLVFDALPFEDVDGATGRLDLYVPAPDSTLEQLANKDPASIRRCVDPNRRTATRLRWDAVPSVPELTPQDLSVLTARKIAVPGHYPVLIGGFDIFETDMARVITPADFVPLTRRIGRVQRLPDDQRGLNPAEIADFQKIEAFYPSAVLCSGNAAPDGGGPTTDGPARGGKAGWFSTAESSLLWPAPMLRRFLGLTAPLAELMPLFNHGQPLMLCISATLPAAPSDLVPSPIRLVLASLQSSGSSCTPLTSDQAALLPNRDLLRFKFTLPVDANGNQARWMPSQLAGLLAGLYWTDIGPDDKALQNQIPIHQNLDARYFAGGSNLTATITVEAWLNTPANPRALADEAMSFTTDLAPRLHPVLADVVDRLRWWLPGDTDNTPAHRRYEPVLDGPPASKAASLADYMAELPPARDPYGWGLLRRLGLATGVKLYDLERCVFQQAAQTLPQVQTALSQILGVYLGQLPPASADTLGQPFVDILAGTDGLFSLSSFDSGVPKVGDDDMSSFVNDSVVCLVQIALRPVPEGLVSPNSPPVTYALVEYVLPDPPAPLPIIPHPPQAGAALFEFIDISGGQSAVQRVPAGSDTALCNGLPATGLQISAGCPNGLGLIRATLTQDVAADYLTNRGFKGVPGISNFAPILKPQILGGAPTRSNGQKLTSDPFGRFDPLLGQALYALHVPLPGAAPGGAAPPSAFSAQSLNRFFAYASARGIGEPPITRSLAIAPGTPEQTAFQKDCARLSEIHAFLGRFSTYGATQAPAADGPDGVPIPFALASLVSHDPWRTTPTADGVMSALFIHDDGWARRRRYVVRPFGRYENLMNGATNASLPATQTAASLPGIADIASLPIVNPDLDFGARSIDLCTPRTQPLLPPTFLSARRLDAQEPVDALDPNNTEMRRLPGRQIEFVLQRHAEEIFSEANWVVADAYQFEGTGLHFFREYAYPSWALGFGRLPAPPVIDGVAQPAPWPVDLELAPALAATLASPDPLPLSFPDASFSEIADAISANNPASAVSPYDQSLTARFPDAWKGIVAWRTADTLYFDRLHAAVHARAGVVVSDVAAATVPEGRAVPRLPWAIPDWAGANLRAQQSAKPVWSVAWADSGAPPPGGKILVLTVNFTLLRHLDAVTAPDYATWLQPLPALPAVLQIPDPIACYALALEAGSAASGAREVAAELIPLRPSGDPPRAAYAVTCAGTRFKLYGPIAAGQLPRCVPVWQGGAWKAQLTLSRAEAAAAPAVTEPTLIITGDAAWRVLCGFLFDPNAFASDAMRSAWFTWSRMISLTVTCAFARAVSSSVADWGHYQQILQALLATYQRLANDPATAADSACVKLLKKMAALNSDQAWRNLPEPTGIHREAVAGWTPGLPQQAIDSGTTYFTVQPLPAAVILPSPAAPPIQPWQIKITRNASFIPSRRGLARMLLHNNLTLQQAGSNPGDCITLIGRLWGAMRGVMLQSMASLSAPTHGYAPVSTKIDGVLSPLLAPGVVALLGGGTIPAVFELPQQISIPTNPLAAAAPGQPPPANALIEAAAALLQQIETAPIPGDDQLDPRAAIASSYASLDEAVRYADTLLAGPQPAAAPPVIVLTLAQGVRRWPTYQQPIAALIAAAPQQAGQAPSFALPASLIMRRPPTDAEFGLLAAALAPVLTADQVRGVLVRLRALASDQLLGSGRTLSVRITRGFAVPVSDVIERGPP